jgi:hypothetical protein
VTAPFARIAAAAAAALALAGCVHARAPVPQTVEGEWARERDVATRRAFLYDGLKHRATATATLQSLAVREARARRLAEWYGWTPAELEDRLAKERGEAAAGEEMLVSFYSAQHKDDDLDAPRSVWRIAVKVDGADLLATRVTSIDRDATTLGLYPYIGPFDTVYRVFLPHASAGPLGGRAFVFEIASALGKLTLDFGQPNGVITPQEPVPPP